ncbi:MAG: helix-turn-helix domain-containing protein [Prevotella sp.]|nr:helix-turn-helix domain-containing protein [Prevotella sp.]MBQ6208376.1 helix-turn-helix domain-containing protein [Prevotella sp.]
MEKIKNEEEYRTALKRIDELLPLINDDTPTYDNNYIELNEISDLVEEYEDIYYPIDKLSLVETIKLRLEEMNLSQAKLAQMLGISPSRMSRILTGKSEPTLKMGRIISQKLNIQPEIVLGI